ALTNGRIQKHAMYAGMAELADPPCAGDGGNEENAMCS
ncbi:hypothetical protein L195_g063214, partial [Trifolium pratense]